MKDEHRRALEEWGVKYENGVERFMGNVALYEKFLLKFLSDASYQNFVEGMESGDMLRAERAVHTMKGTAGNLSLAPLFYVSDTMVNAIRAQESPERLREIYGEVRKTYGSIREILEKIQASS